MQRGLCECWLSGGLEEASSLIFGDVASSFIIWRGQNDSYTTREFPQIKTATIALSCEHKYRRNNRVVDFQWWLCKWGIVLCIWCDRSVRRSFSMKMLVNILISALTLCGTIVKLSWWLVNGQDFCRLTWVKYRRGCSVNLPVIRSHCSGFCSDKKPCLKCYLLIRRIVQANISQWCKKSVVFPKLCIENQN